MQQGVSAAIGSGPTVLDVPDYYDDTKKIDTIWYHISFHFRLHRFDQSKPWNNRRH